MAFFNNKRKDFSIQPPRQQVDGTPFFVTDSANIDFTLLNLNLTANLTQLLPTSGTYGDATHIPILQIDQWGRITGVTTTTFSASGISLETNGFLNDSQTILNLTDSDTIEVVDGGSGVIKFNYIGTSGNTYTSNNGITENPTYNFQLGGPLVQNTEINLAASYQLDILADTSKKMFRASSGTVQLGDIDDVTGLGNINYLQIVGNYTQFLYGTYRYLYADYSTDNSWGFGDIDNRTLGTKLLISDRYQKFEILGGVSSGRYNVPAITVEYGTDTIITKIGDSSNTLNSTAYTCDDTQELHSFSKRLKLLNYTSSTAYQTWTVNGVPFSVTASVGVLNVDGQGNVFVGTGSGSSPLTTKGDLYTFSTVDTRLPVGLDTQVLLADSSTTTGLKWGTNTAPTPLGYYGQYFSYTTQNATTNNIGKAMYFDVPDIYNGISVVTDGTALTKITFANTGIYNLQFSTQFQNTDNAEQDVYIWLRKNGITAAADVGGSTGIVSVPKTHGGGGGTPGHVIATWNFLLDIVAGDFYQIVWSTSDVTKVSIKFLASTVNHPSTASTLFTVTQQSGIMAGTGITAINSLTAAAQTLASTDLNISSSVATHTFSIANNAVTLAKFQQINTSSFLGRVTAATGNIEVLSGTQATTILDVFSSSLKGLAPSSGGGTTNFLRADGTWAVPGGSAGNSIQALAGATTDVTASASLPSQSVAATLATSYKSGSAGVIFDGAGGVIATNTVAYAQVPYNGNITGGQIVANAIGSCTITVRKGTFPPAGAAIVTAVLSGSNTAPVTVSPVVAVASGDWLSFTISGVSTVAWVNLTLSITKTV